MYLYEASVTGTETALLAAATANGLTEIRHAATEPHVAELCQFLAKMGAGVSGIGSSKIRIEGVSRLHGAEHRLGGDYIEAGSWAVVAAITGGEIEVHGARAEDVEGIAFYEINPELRVKAKFLPYHPPKKFKVATVLGYEEELECPGIAEFNLGGTAVQLEPVFETPGDTKLFFMFKDSTNGRETYGGGRYLYSDLPNHGHVILNFNQAHNPYCAYNGFSTCQIPPLQNWLKVPIPAGERKYPESK